jgi:hypothetical protein
MRNRLTIAMAAISVVALATGVAWAARPVASVVATDHVVDVSDAGSVALTVNGAELQVAAVETNPGWTHEVEVSAGREVEVDFHRVDRRINFNAELEDGEIRVKIRERTGSTVIETTSTTTVGSTSTSMGGSTPSTVDATTSTSMDSTSTTMDDDSTSTTIDDDSTSTTIDDDSTSTTIDDDSPAGSGSETYGVGGAATVTVSWADGTMSLSGVSLGDGWRIEKQEVRADRVKLEFENGDDDAAFEARFEDGALRVEIDVD